MNQFQNIEFILPKRGDKQESWIAYDISINEIRSTQLPTYAQQEIDQDKLKVIVTVPAAGMITLESLIEQQKHLPRIDGKLIPFQIDVLKKITFQLINTIYELHKIQNLGRCFFTNSIKIDSATHRIILTRCGYMPRLVECRQFIVYPLEVANLKGYSWNIDLWLLGLTLHHLVFLQRVTSQKWNIENFKTQQFAYRCYWQEKHQPSDQPPRESLPIDELTYNALNISQGDECQFQELCLLIRDLLSFDPNRRGEKFVEYLEHFTFFCKMERLQEICQFYRELPKKQAIIDEFQARIRSRDNCWFKKFDKDRKGRDLSIGKAREARTEGESYLQRMARRPVWRRKAYNKVVEVENLLAPVSSQSSSFSRQDAEWLKRNENFLSQYLYQIRFFTQLAQTIEDCFPNKNVKDKLEVRLQMTLIALNQINFLGNEINGLTQVQNDVQGKVLAIMNEMKKDLEQKSLLKNVQLENQVNTRQALKTLQAWLDRTDNEQDQFKLAFTFFLIILDEKQFIPNEVQTKKLKILKCNVQRQNCSSELTPQKLQNFLQRADYQARKSFVNSVRFFFQP